MPIYEQKLLKSTVGPSAETWKHSEIYRYLLSETKSTASLSEEGLFSYYDDLLKRAKGELQFDGVVVDFIKQAQTESQSAKRFNDEKLNGFNVRVGFGFGNSALVPWLAILGDGQEIQNGIYPCFLYYKKQDYLILALGISAANEPELSWGSEVAELPTIKDFFLEFGENISNYGDSFVLEDFPHASENIDSPEERLRINESLKDALAAYRRVLQQPLVSGDESAKEYEEPKTKYDPYTESNFLNDVFISSERYSILKSLLRRKKNIILQGPPGVGKTYAAQRLAFSIIGKKDTSRVETIQFHQSYSYEDFVMGYRPSSDHFSLEEGPFYKFCKKAVLDINRPYFFIIDEINRGNLSKIFGELLMLIEGDKRGEQNAIQLLYRKDETFFVPENVYIIGMMNTADRSLAMIDYALRRRFAFFDMLPAFDSDGFKSMQEKSGNQKFNALIKTIQSLNEAIAKDLGGGFQIGHSYFCTSDIVNDEWLESVVEYELILLLQEYWFELDESSKAEDWSNQLRSAIRG